jgi:hypothetical protein
MKKTLAICLYGLHPMECLKNAKMIIKQNYTETAWKEHFLKVNNPVFDIFIFMHSWSVVYKYFLLKFWSPHDYIIEQQIPFTDGKYVTSCGSSTMNNQSKQFIYYSHLYSIMKSVELKQKYEKKNKMIFDVAIISRMDIIWLDPIPLNKLNTRDDYVYINGSMPNPKLPMVCDYYFISNSKNIDIIGSLFTCTLDYDSSSFYAEIIKYQHLIKNNLKIQTTNLQAILLRNCITIPKETTQYLKWIKIREKYAQIAQLN